MDKKIVPEDAGAKDLAEQRFGGLKLSKSQSTLQCGTPRSIIARTGCIRRREMGNVHSHSPAVRSATSSASGS